MIFPDGIFKEAFEYYCILYILEPSVTIPGQMYPVSSVFLWGEGELKRWGCVKSAQGIGK